jgi:hypothetical protein
MMVVVSTSFVVCAVLGQCQIGLLGTNKLISLYRSPTHQRLHRGSVLRPRQGTLHWAFTRAKCLGFINSSRRSPNPAQSWHKQICELQQFRICVRLTLCIIKSQPIGNHTRVGSNWPNEIKIWGRLEDFSQRLTLYIFILVHYIFNLLIKIWGGFKDFSQILYTYIRNAHYKLFSVILLTCKMPTSFTNCQLTYHPQLPNHHYIMPHNLV